MKGVHLGSYWMGENDVVYAMAQEFLHYFSVLPIDVNIYKVTDEGVRGIYDENEAFKTTSHKKYAHRREIKSEYLHRIIDRHQPDFVVVNSGGLYFSDQDFEYLRERNIVTVCISLSDPDVFHNHGKYYASKFDLCFTNSKVALEKYYPAVKKDGVYLLPFAASDRLHYPEHNIEKEFDIVVVGHARDDRLPIVNELKKHFKVGLYGNDWPDGQGFVNGDAQRQAINKGKIYLSFAKTAAGYKNVKVGLFEAMACRTVVVTDYMEEVFEYFRSGSEILVYNELEELIGIVQMILDNPVRREWLANNSYKRFINEHSYKARLEFIIEKIKEIKGKQYNGV